MSFQDAVSAAYEGDLTIGGIVHDAVDAVIANFRDPAYRAEFFTATAVAAACGRARLPFIPALVISVTAGKAARWAYTSAEEIKAKLGGSDAAGGV